MRLNEKRNTTRCVCSAGFCVRVKHLKNGIFNVLILYVLSFLFSFNTLSAYTHQTGEINQRDNQGKKQGKWIFFGKDRPSLGYASEIKVEEGNFVDDRKEGKWITYHKDGETPKLIAIYKNNRPEGSFIKYYTNGKIMEHGVFARNLYQDSLKRFYDNGTTKFIVNYNAEGKEHGTVTYFYSNGQKEYQYFANNGKPTGQAYRYYENGDVKEVIFYNEDGKVEKSEQRKMVTPLVEVVKVKTTTETAPKVTAPRTKGKQFQPNGYNKLYNSNDEIWQDGNFKNGLLWDGKIYEYDRDGILLKVKVFKNGMYHSDGQL